MNELQARLLKRTGPCVAGSCTCPAFVLNLIQDTWRLCDCHHTQNSHTVQEGTINS